MEASELDRRLWCIEVEVKYRLSDSPSTKHAVRVKQTDTFRKIKKHVTESLDIQGRMMYGDQNCDEVPNKRLSDYSSRPEETFLLMAERKQRDMKHYAVKLQIPEEYLMKDDDRMMEIKVARTTTISNLKYKIQNRAGIPVEEQSIHVLGQQKECQLGTNVMQLLQPVTLEVKRQRKEGGPPLKPTTVKKEAPQKSSFMSSGAPYDAKPSGKRKAHEIPSTQPKKQNKAAGIHVCIVCTVGRPCKRQCMHVGIQQEL